MTQNTPNHFPFSTPEFGDGNLRGNVIKLGRALIKDVTANPTVGTQGRFLKNPTFSAVPMPDRRGILFGKTSHFEADTVIIEDTGNGLHVETYRRRPSNDVDAKVRTTISDVTGQTDVHTGTQKDIYFTRVDGDEIAHVHESMGREYDLGSLAMDLVQLAELRDRMNVPGMADDLPQAN